MTYLGIDYGLSNIGLAISSGSLAEPLTTVAVDSAISAIKELINKYSVDGIVIGNADSEFITRLNSLNLPVYITDETLSTQDALNALLHTTQTARKKKEHSAAAAIILQTWLDSGRANS